MVRRQPPPKPHPLAERLSILQGASHQQILTPSKKLLSAVEAMKQRQP